MDERTEQELLKRIDVLTGEVAGLRAIVAALPAGAFDPEKAKALAAANVEHLSALHGSVNSIPGRAKSTVAEATGDWDE